MTYIPVMDAPYRLRTLALLTAIFDAEEWDLDTLDEVHQLLVNRGEIVVTP